MFPAYVAMTFIVAGFDPNVRVTHEFGVDVITLGFELYGEMESSPVVVQVYVICCEVLADAGTVVVIFLP